MKKVEIKIEPGKLKSLVVGKKIFRSMYDYELSPEDLEQAREQLGETQEVRMSSLRTLKEMLARDEFDYLLDDEYLLRYLRCKKFDCNKAHQMIRYFYTISKDYPDVFATLPSDYESVLETRLFTVLPYRDEEGSIIFLSKVVAFKPEKHNLYDAFQFYQPIGDIITTNPSCQIHKIISIVDCKDATLRHAAVGLDPRTLRFWTSAAQDSYVWRIKRLIFVNATTPVYVALKVIRQFLKKKIADRIVVIGSDMTELHQYVDPVILPEELGGSLHYSEWGITKHIIDNLPYLEYEQSFRRPKKL